MIATNRSADSARCLGCKLLGRRAPANRPSDVGAAQASAVAVDVLLDSEADLVEGLGAELDNVEGAQAIASSSGWVVRRRPRIGAR